MITEKNLHRMILIAVDSNDREILEGIAKNSDPSNVIRDPEDNAVIKLIIPL